MTTTMITTEADDVIDRLADAIWYLDQLYFDELDDSVNAEYVDLTRESLGWLIEALLRRFLMRACHRPSSCGSAASGVKYEQPAATRTLV